MIDPTASNGTQADSPTGELNEESHNGHEAGTSSGHDGGRIAELEAKLKDQENKYLYLYADFENFKKRTIKERSELIKFGWENVARDLLQVLDNLERGIAHTPAGTDKTLIDGLNMTIDQFRNSLAKQGVTPITSQGNFDPMLHEAVGQEESDQPAGSIVKEHTRGYTLHGRLLRPARVLVSSGNKATPQKT